MHHNSISSLTQPWVRYIRVRRSEDGGVSLNVQHLQSSDTEVRGLDLSGKSQHVFLMTAQWLCGFSKTKCNWLDDGQER